jgi:hypothetical protein
MSITLQPLMAGNALRVFVTRPTGTLISRILRRDTDAFTGHDDAGALLVHSGLEHAVLDVSGLVNGATYFYRVYHWDGAAWSDGGVVSGEPVASYDDGATDVLVLLRDRLIAGLAVEVAAGRLAHSKGVIPVRTAPPQDKDETLPIVTLQLSSDSQADRAVGEDLMGYEDGETEGWLSAVRIELMGWSLNPDERNELRRALKRIVLANLAVFDAAGVVQVNFSQNDTEDFSTYAAPMYQTMGDFTCLAPSYVTGGDYAVIADIPVVAISINP